MPINYTQTDTSFSNTNATTCGSPARPALANDGREATNGGTAGTSALTLTFAGSESLIFRFVIKCTIATATSWNSGTWTWRLNVTTANMNITLEEVNICRLDVSNNQKESMANITGLGVSLGSTGVKSGTVSGTAQTPGVGDYVMLYFVMSNSAMTSQSVGITPNQNINSPFDFPSISNKIFQYNQSVKRGAYI